MQPTSSSSFTSKCETGTTIVLQGIYEEASNKRLRHVARLGGKSGVWQAAQKMAMATVAVAVAAWRRQLK